MDSSAKNRVLIGDSAEMILSMGKLLVQAKKGDNHTLIQALGSALAVAIVESLKDESALETVAVGAGKIVAENIRNFHRGMTLNKKVDIMQATQRMSKGLPLSEEEEAALYAMDLIDKDGKLTELGRQGAQMIEERLK
jgi:hypothetical protein